MRRTLLLKIYSGLVLTFHHLFGILNYLDEGTSISSNIIIAANSLIQKFQKLLIDTTLIILIWILILKILFIIVILSLLRLTFSLVNLLLNFFT